jgi:hypothetical protein
VTSQRRPIYTIRLSPRRGNGIRGLRQILKIARRRYELDCVDAREDRWESLGAAAARFVRRVGGR